MGAVGRGMVGSLMDSETEIPGANTLAMCWLGLGQCLADLRMSSGLALGQEAFLGHL